MRPTSTAVRIAVYLVIGISGVVVLVHGQPMGWIAVGFSGAAIGLRIWNIVLRRQLVAGDVARRAETGYVAPIIDLVEWNRLRARNAKIIVLGFIGPCLAVGIAATWIALVSIGDLQTCAVVIALSMLVSAGIVIFGLRRGLRTVRDDA